MSLEFLTRRLVPVAAAGALLVAAAPAAADPGIAAVAKAAAKKPATTKSLPRRHGGPVRAAWPARKRGVKPSDRLTRFLARQVGPVKGKSKKARKKRGRARASAAALTTPLSLVRSFDIPAGDPAAERMANLSWTYDSAIAAIAFTGAGDSTQARQLLDQLAALQRVDGSIDFAFNVQTGTSVPLFRSGSMAEIGLAGAVYRNVFNSTRYDTLTAGAVKWLLARQQTSGLIAGGPDVTWASTQHNLLTYFFLTALAQKPPTGYSSSTLNAAADKVGDALQSQLLAQVSSTQAAFYQGTNDQMRPLDTQTLGTMFLLLRGEWVNAYKVRSFINTFALANRSIVPSTDPLTFNNTYKASGPFTGYRPYSVNGPDVLWAEGTAQVYYLQRLMQEPSSTLSSVRSMIGKWNAVSGTKGPLGADKTVTDHAVNEYHVWPTSAAASWTLIGDSNSYLGFSGDWD